MSTSTQCEVSQQREYQNYKVNNIATFFKIEGPLGKQTCFSQIPNTSQNVKFGTNKIKRAKGEFTEVNHSLLHLKSIHR